MNPEILLALRLDAAEDYAAGTIVFADGVRIFVTSPFDITLASWAVREQLPYSAYAHLSAALKQRAFSTALELRPALLADLHALIESAMRFGLPFRELLDRADKIFERFGGAKGIPAYRLELPFRQNWITSLNMGRYAFQFSPEGVRQSPLWEYMAVHDHRTDATLDPPICLELDGLIFDKADPDAGRLLPQQHFNCRCLALDYYGSERPVRAREIFVRGLAPAEGFDFDKRIVPGWMPRAV